MGPHADFLANAACGAMGKIVPPQRTARRGWFDSLSSAGWLFLHVAGVYRLRADGSITQVRSDWRAGEGQEHALGWGRTGSGALWCGWWRVLSGICTILTLDN